MNSFPVRPQGFKRALLYISHLSADDELRNEKFLLEIIKSEPDSAVFACDVREQANPGQIHAETTS
jgi:hypothetical protein